MEKKDSNLIMIFFSFYQKRKKERERKYLSYLGLVVVLQYY